jgi:hypothetical protein
MKKNSNYLVSGLLVGSLGLFAGPVFADPYNRNHYDGHHPLVGVREVYQTLRIQEGVKSGSLTPAEANELKAQQRAIRKQKNALRADGKLDGQELHRLNVELDRQSENIYQQKRNGQHR